MKGSRPKIPPLPALSLNALIEVENLENNVKGWLERCDGIDFNLEKAERILRTAGVEIVNKQLAYYRSLPNHDERWAGEIIVIATGSIIGLLPGGAVAFKDSLRRDLLEAIIESGDWKNRLKDARSSPPPETPKSRRDRIDQFIAELLIHGRSVTRTDIWKMAGYANRTEFERFQRHAKPENKSAARKFEAILRLNPYQFIARLDKIVSP